MHHRRLLASIALLLNCSPPKAAPTGAQEPQPPAPFVIETASPLVLDSTTPSAVLIFSGPECGSASVSVTVRDGTTSKVLTVMPATSADGYVVQLPRGGLAPAPKGCDAERRYSMTATITCDGGDPAPIEGRVDVIERFDATLEARPLSNQRGHFFARLFSAPRGGQWEYDGDSVAFRTAANVAALVTVTNVRAAAGAPVEVTGAAHAFLSTEVDPTSAAEGFAIADDTGAVFFMRDAWITGVPLTATGVVDGRTGVRRIRVPAPVVDLAMSGDTLYVLSQAASRVVLSKIQELTTWPTDATISPDAVTTLPYTESKGFAAGPSAQLEVMAANADDGTFELFNPMLSQKETEPETPCTGAAPAPIPYPTPSGGSTGSGGGTTSGSSSFPMSNGDQPGSAGGVISGTKGCIKQFSPDVKFPSREPFTTADGAYAWTGAYANTPGLLALVFASTTDANASTRRVLLLDVVTEATRWLVFPTPAGPSRDAGVHRLMFAPDGTRLVISGDHRYDVFSRDGAWLAGESALPEGCGVIQDVVIDAAHRLRVRLAR